MENQQIIEKVAEYLSIAPFLKVDSPQADYQRARQLVYELFMVLPEQLYIKLTRAIQGKDGYLISHFANDIRETFGDNRELIDINLFMSHAPGIGKKE